MHWLSFLIGLLRRYKATPPQLAWVLLERQEHFMLEWQANLPFNLTWGYLPISLPPLCFHLALPAMTQFSEE